MNVKTTLSITDGRKQLFDIAKEVQKPGKYYTLTEKGKPAAVIISAEEYESMVETLEVMRDFPDLEKDIKAVEAEYARGEFILWGDLKKEWESKSLISQKKDVLPARSFKKGSQRSRKASTASKGKNS